MRTFIPSERSTAGHPQKRPSAIARLLLVVFSGMVLVPLLPASVLQAGLAMCCKRDGKHLCIAPISLKSAVSLPEQFSVSEKCPYSLHSLAARTTTVGMTATPTLQTSACERWFNPTTYSPTFFFVPSQQANLKRGPPLPSSNLRG